MTFIGGARLTCSSITAKEMEDKDWKTKPYGFKTYRTESEKLDRLTSGVGLNYKHKSDV